ncbi:GDP-L-fucose synthase [Pseudodesulfovibrio nedwellii]|uniref:GDP-L-fucose synthase n=1 Tax=Pseudodesulfovibrio nedwellii TaxID=2973072 RepID=A0ABM8B2U0_9BACT|nr:NAD-dependent epimerase/dehydratase family protein [Pseudodesulfovibrio nedwellii]BDQ38068.1 GDP-L-fucose synthase [Pseudodesulfovibrio nedwellii]
MKKDARIFVAGHRGLVGGAIVRCLKADGYTNLFCRTHAELDLTRQDEVDRFFAEEQPEYVFLAAAKVGGIYANSTYPADFIRDNLLIQSNIVDAAFVHATRKLLFLGSSCIYPREAPQPIPEDALLSGPLEPTNESYAVAKIAGIKLCQAMRRQHGFDAISAMPTNLYGPGDNFHPENSHVVPGLMRRFHEAKLADAAEVAVWGTGAPLREFLHVDDLAEALVFLMEHYSDESIVNVGSGVEVSIAELVKTIKRVVGFQGAIRFERPEMDGTPRKLVDSSRLYSMGWKPKHSLEQGLADTYAWFKNNAVG